MPRDTPRLTVHVDNDAAHHSGRSFELALEIAGSVLIASAGAGQTCALTLGADPVIEAHGPNAASTLLRALAGAQLRGSERRRGDHEARLLEPIRETANGTREVRTSADGVAVLGPLHPPADHIAPLILVAAPREVGNVTLLDDRRSRALAISSLDDLRNQWQDLRVDGAPEMTVAAPTSPTGDRVNTPDEETRGQTLISDRLTRELGAAGALGLVIVPAVLAIDGFLAARTERGLLLICALLPVVIGVITRRFGFALLSWMLGTIASGALTSLLLARRTLGSTLAGGWRPTGATVDGARQALREAARMVQNEASPLPVRPGLVLIAGAGLWFLGTLMDASAFRLGSTGDAVAPALGAVVLAGILGPGDHRSATALAFAVGVAVFVIAHQQHTVTASGWLGNRLPSSWRPLAASGIAAILALALAGVVAPRLPGYGDPPLANLDLDASHAPRQVISPLVSLAAQLGEQSNVEMFVVRAPTAAYWRLTGLERFDGTRFSIRGERGRDEPDPPVAGRPLQHRVEILGLRGSPWVPVAYRAADIDGPGRPRLRGSTRTARIDRSTRTGDVYDVTAMLPIVVDPGPEPIGTERPGDPLLLHSPISPAAAELAERFAAQYPGQPYRQLVSLQQWFRAQFVYDLGVGPPQGDNALDDFLFRTRTGFCQHFATAFAALARSLGYPARVGVGFVPGERQDDGSWLVRGRDAHAWPEVWVAGLGWVAFEPTPGRGVPAWAPDGVVTPVDAGGIPVPTAPPATTPLPLTTSPPSTPTTVPTPAGDEQGVGWWAWALLLAGASLVAVGVLRQRRNAWRRSEPDGMVAGAWAASARQFGRHHGRWRADESAPGLRGTHRATPARVGGARSPRACGVGRHRRLRSGTSQCRRRPPRHRAARCARPGRSPDGPAPPAVPEHARAGR